MHVYLLAGLPGTPSESSEHEERVARLDLHHRRVGVVSARLLRKPNARGNLQQCKLFARDLQSALEATRAQCRLRMREAWRAIPAYGARLRGRLAHFLAKAKHPLTQGAYHRGSTQLAYHTDGMGTHGGHTG